MATNIKLNATQNRATPATQLSARPLPKNYVNQAETLVREQNLTITASKLRNLMSLIVEPYNEALRMRGDSLREAQQSALQAARIRMVYECGRDNAVKDFIEKTNLLSYLLDIGTCRQKLVDYYHYVEALVAYVRYYGNTKGNK